MDLMKLADNMVLQSARAADLLLPMNEMIHTMETTTPSKSNQPLFLPPTSEKGKQDLALIPMQQVKDWKELTNNPNASNKQSSWLTGGSKLAMKMTFISDILEPLLQSEKVLASDRGIHFEVEGLDVESSELPGVLICPQALQEALVNVLDNAITYVKMGHRGQADVINPSPHIRVGVHANDPSIGVGVTILIEDNGPGVPPSEHQSIFYRGYRSKRTQQSSGSGIGLDISRSLIELMGGSLDIVENSSMDSLQGAAFQIILLRNPPIKNR
jgi:K+-sensing histidine kinase KdpD